MRGSAAEHVYRDLGRVGWLGGVVSAAVVLVALRAEEDTGGVELLQFFAYFGADLVEFAHEPGRAFGRIPEVGPFDGRGATVEMTVHSVDAPALRFRERVRRLIRMVAADGWTAFEQLEKSARGWRLLGFWHCRILQEIPAAP
jgi:hypothetical protein